MVMQIYPFSGNDFDSVYRTANDFIARLSASFGIEVKPDQIHENTKNYPDQPHRASHTTISVMPNVDEEQIGRLWEIRGTVIREMKAREEHERELERVFAELEEAGKLLFRHRDEWCVSAEGDLWSAKDTKTGAVLVPPSPANKLLGRVKAFLLAQGFEDDRYFDPFLDEK